MTQPVSTDPSAVGDAATPLHRSKSRGLGHWDGSSAGVQPPSHAVRSLGAAISKLIAAQRKVAVVVMGVSGCGKSTHALQLYEASLRAFGSQSLNRNVSRFLEGDDFHDAASVAKMRRGVPLTDKERLPWLRRLKDQIHSVDAPALSFVACSALRQRYRQILSGGGGATPAGQRATRVTVFFLHLQLPERVVRTRLARRPGHFASPSISHDQLAILEPVDPAAENGVNVELSGDERLADVHKLALTKVQRYLEAVVAPSAKL